jgi:hypothetical protein
VHEHPVPYPIREEQIAKSWIEATKFHDPDAICVFENLFRVNVECAIEQ